MSPLPAIRPFGPFAALLVLLLWGPALPRAAADETPLVRLTFRPQPTDARPGAPTDEPERTLDGKILLEAGDGGLVFCDRAGRIWLVPARNVGERVETGKTFQPFSQEEMAELLRGELGADVTIWTTKHYVFASQAGREYARWTGLLFERLLAAFGRQWDRRPLEVGEPEFPLVAVVLKDRQAFADYALKDAGPGAVNALGYYSKLTNRVVMYDLTAGGPPPQNVYELNRRLAAQTANVATIVHEATHQIAFNCGLHVRLADNPFWLVEGMAMYFETPDLNNASGWNSVGKVNGMRLDDFKDYAARRRKPGALRAMLADDGLFHVADTAVDNYAESWALTYFLIRTRRAAYVDYLAALHEKPTLERDDKATRLAEFEQAFGPIDDLEKEMMKYLARLKPGR